MTINFTKIPYGMPIALLFMIFLSVPEALGVNYRDLAIEERRNKIKQQFKSSPPPVETDKEYEKEKDLIFRQLSVITGDEDTRYIIVPGDTLTIAYQDRGKRVTNMYKVDGKGEIHMPLAGAVKVSDLNRQQMRGLLNEVLGEYIRYPEVSILVNNTGSYMVIGAAGPGVFELNPDLRLMEAILRTGYDENRANLANVIVMRGGRDNPVIMNLNLRQMVKEGDRRDDILVKPGDLIYVPNTLMYNFDKFKNKMFDYILDYYTFGGSTLIKQ